MKKKILIIIQIFLAMIIGYNGYKIYDYSKSVQEIKSIELKSEEKMKTIQKSILDKKDDKDFYVNLIKELKQDYPDAIGQINISNTPITYPIVQTDNNSFYLNRAPDKKWNPIGSIFMDYTNNPNFEDDNTVIYGHNTRSGKMFASLHKLKKQEFYNENNIIEIYTDQGLLNYKIFAVYITEPEYEYRKINYDNLEEKNQFIKEIIDKSVIKTNYDNDLFDDAKILTLSTCETGGKKRLAIHGYRISETLVEPSQD